MQAVQGHECCLTLVLNSFELLCRNHHMEPPNPEHLDWRCGTIAAAARS
ncbi:MAG: hypothetical protein KatS3mg110_4556 [Pirellulaceae bacterium]|nr:MAG: hypothetical protein KatS3mg110_4556 [Pirellulaceae bacterium]